MLSRMRERSRMSCRNSGRRLLAYSIRPRRRALRDARDARRRDAGLRRVYARILSDRAGRLRA